MKKEISELNNKISTIESFCEYHKRQFDNLISDGATNLLSLKHNIDYEIEPFLNAYSKTFEHIKNDMLELQKCVDEINRKYTKN